ncbi:MAG: hypothetical protein ACK5NN_14310 [Sphingomonadaceae bacterium]
MALAAQALSILALVPAAANPSLLMTEASTLSAGLCGTVNGVLIEIPLGDPVLPGTVGTACCSKGCHSSSRKSEKRAAG